MILCDTTIVIDYARGKDPKLASLIAKHQVATCGIVRTELLWGARDSVHRTKILTLLATFSHLTLPEALWDLVGDNLALLRRRGVTIPFSDGVIATVGIENDIEVWSRDQHFPLIKTVLPQLRLFQEPL